MLRRSVRPVVYALVVLYGVTAHLLIAEFHNDHFVHLSRAAQTLRGDLPIRDFAEPLGPLQTLVSALALAVSGHNLLGEAVICSLALAIATALVVMLCRRATGSQTLGIVLAVPLLVIPIRLYSYPKVLVPLIVLAALWWCLDEPDSRFRLTVLGSGVALAFLFRHDFVLYVIPAVAVGFALLQGSLRLVVRRLLIAATAALVVVLPFLVYVQLSVGLPDYIGSTLRVGSAEQARTGSGVVAPLPKFNGFPLIIDPPEPPIAQVNVRYRPEVQPEQRRFVEQLYGLSNGTPLEDDPRARSWQYNVAGYRSSNYLDLVQDERAEDTHGLDRQTGELSELPPRRPLSGSPAAFLFNIRVPLADAVAWLFYLTLLSPVLVLGAVLVMRRDAASAARLSVSPAHLAAAATLLLAAAVGLLRAPLDVRLQDVTGLAAVGLACSVVCVRWFFSVRTRTGVSTTMTAIAGWALGALVLAVTMASWLAVAEAAGGAVHVDVMRSAMPASRATAMREKFSALRQHPLSNDPRKLAGLPLYVNSCTGPADRTFATWFAPEFYFYADRGFAGPQVYILAGYYDLNDQHEIIKGLRKERVPIIAGKRDNRDILGYPLLARYLDKRYMQMEWSKDPGFIVYIDRKSHATSQYGDTVYPCFS